MRLVRLATIALFAGLSFWACQDDEVVAPGPTFPLGDYVGTAEILQVTATPDTTVLTQPIRINFSPDGEFALSQYPGPDGPEQVFCDAYGEYEVTDSGLRFSEIDSNFTRGWCPLERIGISGFWTVDSSGNSLVLYRENYNPINGIEYFRWLRLRRM